MLAGRGHRAQDSQAESLGLPQDSGNQGRAGLQICPGGKVSAFIRFSKGPPATLQDSRGHCIQCSGMLAMADMY